METGNDLVAEPSQYSSDFGHSFKMKINEISLYFNGLRFHLSILPKSNYLPLCCFTGLAFSDIHGLRKEHIVEDSNGVRWIRKGRQKTKIMCNIPLMEIPLKILEKYSTNEYCKKHGVLFPVLCNQKMNAYLKELADICGIKKTLTTHVGRHTFATFALANGVSIESVAKMLGHTNVQMTRHYARVLDRTVIREMSQIKMDFHISI
ncbi:integrase catalytic domain-containing protein [Bacteroides vulgatus]|nr:integrase catalytic domain-containing protein [Phocaeicola vulgatus]